MDPGGADQTDLDYLLGSVGVSSGLAPTAVTSGTPAVGLASQHGGVASTLAPSVHGVVPSVAGLPLASSVARGNPANANNLVSMRGGVHASLGAPLMHNQGNRAHLAGDEASANDTATGTPDSTTTNNNLVALNHNNDHTATTPPIIATTAGKADNPQTHNISSPIDNGTVGDNSAQGAAAGGAAGANSKKRPLEDKKARDRKRILRNRQLARVSNERRKGRIKAMENELTETRQTVTTLEESIRCLEEENRELRNLLHGKPDGNPSIAQPPPPAAPPSIPPPVPPSL